MKSILPILLIALVTVYKLQADHSYESKYNQISLSRTDNSIPFSFQLGMTYYKDALRIVENMDPNADLIQIMETQDKTVLLLKKSLQLIEAAERINPENVQIKAALIKIYKALNMPVDNTSLASR